MCAPPTDSRDPFSLPGILLTRGNDLEIALLLVSDNSCHSLLECASESGDPRV